MINVKQPAKLALAGFFVLAATGCAEVPVEVMGPDFGDGQHRNIAVHVIDPMPAHADAGAPDFNGNRAALAIQRYEANRVTQPATTATTTVLSGGGSGGGAGGGGR